MHPFFTTSQPERRLEQPYSVAPSVYPLSSPRSSHVDSHLPSSIDLPSLVAVITHACDERQRVQHEWIQHSMDVATAHIAHLAHCSYAMQSQLSAMQQRQRQPKYQVQHHEQQRDHQQQRDQQQHSNAAPELMPDEADDVAEKDFEVQDLHSWEQASYAAEIRGLMERVEELAVRVQQLERHQGMRCHRCDSQQGSER